VLFPPAGQPDVFRRRAVQGEQAPQPAGPRCPAGSRRCRRQHRPDPGKQLGRQRRRARTGRGRGWQDARAVVQGHLAWPGW